MSYADEARAIRDRFRVQWAARTPIAPPNVTYAPPSDKKPWVRLSILPGGANEAGFSFGDKRRYRHDGLISVQVFTPDNSGDGVAMELAEAACGIFRSETFSGVRCLTPYISGAGPDGVGWYMVNVWCPYTRDTFY